MAGEAIRLADGRLGGFRRSKSMGNLPHSPIRCRIAAFPPMLARLPEINPAGESDHAALRRRPKPSTRPEKQSSGDLRSKRRAAKPSVVKVAFGKNGNDDGRVLVESLKLQGHLRREAHRSLAAQEEGRLKISHDLQDEVGQTLLGIHARLDSLKQTARRNPEGLRGEIALAQSLVAKSAGAVRRLARKLDLASNGWNRPARRTAPRGTPGFRHPPGHGTKP